jgi:Tol biopolymer transport system component
MSKCLITIGCAAIALASACGSDSTRPNPQPEIPSFVYVSNENGSDQLFTYSNGNSAVLAGSVSGDIDPQSAHGRIVFTSFRDSPTNSEIYSMKNDGSDVLRLTNNPARDFSPTLSPDGATVVFASLRSGTSRLWSMNSDGTNPVQLITGSTQYTPETAPRFSPDGTQILFNSPRSGTSQLFLMSAAGDTAKQLTHEANGAFDGSWSSDGANVFYVDGSDHTVIHKLTLADSTVTSFVTGGTDVGQPACNASLCLVVSGRTSGAGDIYSYTATDSLPFKVVGTTGNERQPALLVP